MTLEQLEHALSRMIPSTSYNTQKLEIMAVLGDSKPKFYQQAAAVGWTGWFDVDGYRLFFSPTSTAILQGSTDVLY